MIFLGLGGNMPSQRFGPPRATLDAALEALPEQGIQVRRRSRWYRTQPLTDDGQPWYVNGVAEIETAFPPRELLARLLETEREFGRERRERWAPRVLDLDLLAYHELNNWETVGGAAPVLPHPHLHERAFVLAPLAELVPAWRHPVLGRTVGEMLAALPPGQFVAALEPQRMDASAGAVAGAPSVR
jgi:2-amino-4-hydroxy-6-hydroxymethyldihydropteridine diphosphokinase